MNKIIAKSTNKTKTNKGDLCRLTFRVIEGEQGVVVSIEKLVLTDDMLAMIKHGFIVRRKFKDKYLVYQNFSIRLNTLMELNKFLNKFYDVY